MSATPATATCATCRRSVVPQRGALGATCPRCGGFLPHSQLPKRGRVTPSPRISRAEVTNQVAEELLEEYRDRVRSVAEFARLHVACTDAVAEADQLDFEDRQRRENGRHWRERMPELVEALT